MGSRLTLLHCTCADDPHVEPKKAALARFMKPHPHNIAQKPEVMVEHFQAVTRHKISAGPRRWPSPAAGIQAVQTLLRINRTYPLKEDTFFSPSGD